MTRCLLQVVVPLLLCGVAGTAVAQDAASAPAGRANSIDSARLLPGRMLGPFSTAIELEPGTEIAIEHSLQLQAYPGTASRLALKFKDPKIRPALRLVAVVDGQLSAIPLEWVEQFSTYQTKFVTPKDSLEYQFQLEFADGRTVVSKWFALAKNCLEQDIAAELAGAAAEKQKIIEELILIDSETASLTHVLSSLDYQGKK